MEFNVNRNTRSYEDEYETDNRGYGHLIVLAVLMVIFAGIGVYFLMQLKSYNNITGYVLTKEYVSDYCRKSQCFHQGFFSMISALLMLMSLLSHFSKKSRARMTSPMFQLILMVIIGIIFTALPAYKTYKVFNSEPVVSTSQITDMYTRRGRSSRSYYFKFADGSKIKVSGNEYRSAHIGDTYYIAYFDGTAAECFNADSYSLPE